MQISFEEEQQVFHLYNDKISYVIQVEKTTIFKALLLRKKNKEMAQRHQGLLLRPWILCESDSGRQDIFSGYTVEGISGVRTGGLPKSSLRTRR